MSAAETDEEGSQDFIKSGRIEIEKVDLPLGTPSDLKPQEEEVAVAAAVEESTDARSEEGSMYESDRECSNDEDNSSSDHILNSKTKKQLKGALKHESTGPYSSHSKSRAQKMVKFEVVGWGENGIYLLFF